jgi:hypothetical protein
MFLLDAWRYEATGVNIRVFANPADFFATLRRDLSWAKSLDLVITDHFFDDETGTTSVDVASQLASSDAFEVPLVVSSNLFASLPRHPTVRRYIDKMPLNASGLKQLLQELKSSDEVA